MAINLANKAILQNAGISPHVIELLKSFPPVFIPPGFIPGLNIPIVPPAQAGPAVPAAPAAPAARALADELAGNIPLALDGLLITADHFNAVREAILRVADKDGVGIGRKVVTVAPTFFPVTDAAGAKQGEWVQQLGAVAHPVGQTTSRDGWMQVSLPEGSRVVAVTAFGKRAGGTATSFVLRLLAQKLTDPATPTLFEALVKDNEGDPFTLPLTSKGTADELSVRGAVFKYFLRATLTGPDAAATAAIHGFQIVCDPA